MKENKTYDVAVESSNGSYQSKPDIQESAKAKPGESHLDAIRRIYGEDHRTQKDPTKLIIFLRENGYPAVADFLEYAKKQPSS